MVQHFKLTTPQSRASNIAGKVGGLFPRTATGFAGIPRVIGDVASYASGFNPANLALKQMGVPEDIRMKIGVGEGPNLLQLAPSSNEMNNWLKQKLITNENSPVRNYLPRNLFDEVPMLDNPIQNILLAPLFGASRIGSVIPSFFGEGFREAGEAMNMGGLGQTLLEALGFVTGNKAQQLGKWATGKVIPATKATLDKYLERHIPGAREANKIAVQEERAARKASQTAAKEAEKLNTQRERFNAESNKISSEEDWQSLKTKEAEAKAKAKETERLRSQLEKTNQQAINEATSRDVDMMKRRTKNANAIDKFQAENDHIMSLEDANTLKEKIRKGEVASLEDWIDNKSKQFSTEADTHARQLQDLHVQDTIATQVHGAPIKDMKNRASRLYEMAEKNIPEDLVHEGSRIEAAANIIDKATRSGKFSSGPGDWINQISKEARELIKNGRVNIKDLMAWKKAIGARVADLRRQYGDLINVEKLYPNMTKAIDTTIAAAGRKNPKLPVNDWFEANRITKQLATDAEASKWINSEFNKGMFKFLSYGLEKASPVFRNPEVRRNVESAISKYASKDITQATKDLIKADRYAEKTYNKDKINIPKLKTSKVQRFKVEF